MTLLGRAIVGLLRLRPVRAAFLFFAPLFERAISHFYGMKKVALGASLEAESDARFEKLVDRHSEEMVVSVVEHALARATPGARRRFFLWAEEKASLDPAGLAYAERTFAGLKDAVLRAKSSLEGLRILELGPGQTLVAGVLFYVHGAKSYTAVDLYPVPTHDAAIYARLREHLASRPELLVRFDEAVRLEGSNASLEPPRVEHRFPVDASRLPFPDASFDVVISLAAFEHFEDPEAAIKECARVTAPGGLGLHQIDMRDHRDFAKPLEFLRVPDEEWRRLAAGKPSYTNRLRKSDFERAFAAAGFEVASVDVNIRTKVAPELRGQLDARFRDRADDDLEAVSAFFSVRRRPAGAPASSSRSTDGTTSRA
jgi:SAM-dependent methyltransferase